MLDLLTATLRIVGFVMWSDDLTRLTTSSGAVADKQTKGALVNARSCPSFPYASLNAGLSAADEPLETIKTL